MFKLIFGRNRTGGKSLETRRIGIKGMAGKANEVTVKKALLSKAGVREVYINRDEGVVSVSFDPAMTDVDSLNEVILRKGFFPVPVEE
jgi:hypothetical protein